MKIGIVCYPTFGGSGVVATELGKALAKKGHMVHFITYSEPVRLGSYNKNIFYHEVRVSDYPLFDYPPYELVLSSKLVDVVKHEGLDVLHVHYAIPHASAAYMARQILKSQGIYIPFITTLHGTDITLVGRDQSFEPVITFAINQSDAVTAVSESLKEDTYKHFGTTRDIHVVPNFVNVDKIRSNDREIKLLRKDFAPNGEKILSHISNFRPVKRMADIVEVFYRVRQEIPAKLLLIGDGPERQTVENMCRKYHLCDDVILLGKLKSPTDALFISDLFLLPSETESFGLAALEAMAASVPVISSNSGGIPEVNQQGYSGFLSNVGDVDDMAANALHLLKDEALLSKFKDQALSRARDFELSRILPIYEELYERVIREGKSVTLTGREKADK
jgi:N-acetyl-alpha-D-glucosaminyl L-malate synthase BshA